MKRVAPAVAFVAVSALPLITVDLDRQWAVVLLMAVVASALNFVSGLAGQISLGHGALMGVGAYSAAYLTAVAGWQPHFALLPATAAGALAGLLMGLPSLRVTGQFLALTTIGGGFMFRAVIGETESLGGVSGLGSIPSIGGIGEEWMAWLLLVAVVAGSYALNRSRVGRALAAVKESEQVAGAVGINAAREKVIAFVFSASVSAGAGALLAFSDGFVSRETFDLSLSLALLTACLIGGLGHPLGGGLGALLFLGPFVIWPQSEPYRLVILGPLALAVLFWTPEGLTGVYRKARGAWGLDSLREVREGKDFGESTQGTLEVEGVSKSFGGLRALDRVSLVLESGRIHALIGANGSGKTTCVACISGHARCDEGQVLVDGAKLGAGPHAAARVGIARTFQHPERFTTLSAAEAVALGAYRNSPAGYLSALLRGGRHRAHEAEAAARATWALGLTGLSSIADRGAGSLSYGQTKRLELARAMAMKPRFLLVDEPSAGLAEEEVRDLGSVLGRLRDAGVGVLLVDHNIGFVMSLADEVTVLDEGRVIAHGTPEQVRSRPDVRTAYLGEELSQ